MLILALGALWWYGSAPPMSPTKLLAEAQSEQKQGRFARAEELAARAVELDPQLNDALLIAAESAAAQQAWSRALEYYERFTSPNPAVQLVIQLRQAEILHHRLPQLADAERAYRAALEITPDNISANAGLVKLLSLCGRKGEATPHILSVIRQGQEFDTLLLFVRDTIAIDDVELLERARQADPSDPNPLLGLAWHGVRQNKLADAWRWLHRALEIQPENVPARLLEGQLLVKENRTEEFPTWAQRLPSTADAVGETWLLRGQMAEALGQSGPAIRCYWEALRRIPESKAATYRLVHLLGSADELQLVEIFRKRLQRILDLEEMQNRVLFVTDQGRPELLIPLAKAYENAGRLWEAYGWSLFAISIGNETTEAQNFAAQLGQKLSREPLQLVTDAANVALTVDLSHHSLPTFGSPAADDALASQTSHDRITFRNDAEAAGLSFRYFNGVEGPTTHRMFEFTGGGIGVLDFDLNGYPDLFLTQGCAWPPGSVDTSGGDRLFRNRAGTGFEDVTKRARIVEEGFSQGVTIGDYDADGFPDVYVANIGRNRLWRNLGDGTFQDVTQEAGFFGDEWTTSTVLADLTGDGWPDVYDVNYVTSADVFERVCQQTDGSPALCMPFDFEGQPDRLWVNSGDGQFREATAEVLGETPLGMGLGAAAWDADGNGRLSLYVANDTTPSFFFRPETAATGSARLRESGLETGLALNGSGKATGCMGVALGDVDQDGRLDLHVTNFYAEPSTLFINSSPGFFEDQTRRRGLEASSLTQLGFGTQFLDADLDGHLELFVSNGHVDDLTRLNRPYRMPPQLFRWDDAGRFRELPGDRLGSYFAQTWVGRSAVRLDWNRDGREDLAVGHLHDPLALLTNVSDALGHHLSLRLFGVQSNRDAVGATVEARIGSKMHVRQVTAGDGYHASNERRLIFGAGGHEQLDELIVRWPSGLTQRFQQVAIPGELWLREGGELVSPSLDSSP